jgi:hypothetical protein
MRIRDISFTEPQNPRNRVRVPRMPRNQVTGSSYGFRGIDAYGMGSCLGVSFASFASASAGATAGAFGRAAAAAGQPKPQAYYGSFGSPCYRATLWRGRPESRAI